VFFETSTGEFQAPGALFKCNTSVKRRRSPVQTLPFRFKFLLSAGLLTAFLWAGQRGSSAEYLGGTLESLPVKISGSLYTDDPHCLLFQTQRTTVRIPYERINQIEYGQKVDRRYLEAVLLSPLFVLSKKRAHFLTVGYETEEGRQQALLFRVDKSDIRAVLVSLEARTGRKVSFQDEEARKAGKG
jgi:hypothetical protein